MDKKCKCKSNGKVLDLKKGMIINGKVIDKVMDWKLYYDMEVKKVCGQYDPAQKVNKVIMSALDEMLPSYINQPQWVEERKAILIVFK